MSKPDYDTTIARMAGNIASGLLSGDGPITNPLEDHNIEFIAKKSVALARAIVAETKRTQPPPSPEGPPQS